MKVVSVFVSLFIFSASTYSQCLSYDSIKINNTSNVVKRCYGDTIYLNSWVKNVLGTDSVKYFWNPNPNFNPDAGQGNFMKSAKISTPIDTTPCSLCPTLQSVFINSCNGTGAEQDNEFIIFHSGSGFNASNFQLTYNSTNSSGATNLGINITGSSCALKTPSVALMDSIRSSSGCNSANVIVVTPTTPIPANSIVIFFCSSNVTKKYDFSTMCGSGIKLYVMQSSCQRNNGAFTNAASTTAPPQLTILGLSNCSNCKDSFKYSRVGLSNVDGEFAIRDASGMSTKANNTILVNVSNPCEGPLSTFSANLAVVDTIRFVLNRNTLCGYDTLYLKGVFKNHPNTILCPDTSRKASSPIFKLVLMCPNAQITSNPYICHGDTIKAYANNTTSRAASTNTYVWSNSLTVDTIKIARSGAYSVILNENGCYDTAFYTTIKSDPKITKVNALLDSCISIKYLGKSFTNDTTIYDTLKTTNGICDSIIYSQNIKILQNDTSILERCFLIGTSYLFYGTNYSSGGTYYQDSSVGKKCFHVFKLKLNEVTPNKDTQGIVACTPTYVFGGKTYSQDTMHRDTVKSFLGCDSFIHCTQIEFVKLKTDPLITISGCQSLTFKGNTYTHSINIVDTIKSRRSLGCDSIHRPYFIKISPSPQIIIQPSLDSCLSIRYMGRNYFVSTVIRDTIRKEGSTCDSIIYQTTLMVSKNDTQTQTVCINTGNSYTFYGNRYSSAGIYYHRVAKNNKCIEVYTLNLSVRPVKVEIPTPIISCGSHFYKGYLHTKDTLKIDTLKYNQGCDSAYVRQRIQILKTKYDTVDIIACDSATFENTNYWSSDSFSRTILYRNAINCDSVQIYYRIIVHSSPQINIMKDLQPPYIKDLVLRLSTSAAGKYQWSTGSKTNTTLITLDTTQFYYLTVTNQDNNCSKIDSIKIIVDTMPVVYIPNIFSPDGDGLNDYFEIFSSNPHFYLEEMILFNRWGQKLYEGRGNDSKWDGKFHGEYQPIGVYVLLLKYKLYNSIRLHSGGITLVR